LADVVRVVHVGESVVRKRLMEFDKTATSALSLEEFMEVDLEETADPPAYSDARAKVCHLLQLIDVILFAVENARTTHC
jgi:transcription factor IIIB subunit 2